jgi:nucleotide-binding universal stress UspA family protein
MAIKDILLALTSYPVRTPDTAVSAGVAIAAALDARLTAIACEARIELPGTILGSALIDLPAIAAEEAKKSSANVADLYARVEAEAKKRGINTETISEKLFTGDIPHTLAEYARFRDLTILPIPNGDDLDQLYAETVIFESGRPVLVIPAVWYTPFRLDTAVIAWDFSKTAARAIADANPLLLKTKVVHVVTVTNEKQIETQRSATELARHLAHHGIKVNIDTVGAAGHDIGTALRSYCTSRNADLLIMGAYGHSRIREFVLGGATRSMLSDPTLPVLMSH